MNETLKVIKERRTTRKFQSHQIPKEALEAIIEAGLYAPSAHNHQSWHFTVVQDSNLLEEMNIASKEAAKDVPDEMIQSMARNDKFNIFYNAPTIVIVSGHNEGMMPEVDCAAATQNMLIAAESLDIGACWNGFVGLLFNSEKGQDYVERLSIPENYRPYYAVALGYKDFRPSQAPARKDNAVSYF